MQQGGFYGVRLGIDVEFHIDHGRPFGGGRRKVRNGSACDRLVWYVHQNVFRGTHPSRPPVDFHHLQPPAVDQQPVAFFERAADLEGDA